MKILQKMKKSLALTLIALIAFSTTLPMTAPVAEADFLGEVGEWLGSAFSTGDEGLTFTQYEGETIELSKEDFDSALTTSSDIREFITRIVNFGLSFLGLIAVIIVIYGGVLYVTAAGDEEKTGKGKKAIQYAAIGLIIVMGSFAFVNTIIRGAGDEEGLSGSSAQITAGTTGGGFNSSAEQVRSIAIDIFNGFAIVSESIDEIEGITGDVRKDSLNPQNLPGKQDVLSFLRSVRGKLQNLNRKVEPFSEASTAIKSLIRGGENRGLEILGVDREIDTIENLTTFWYNKASGAGCDPGEDSPDGFTEGFRQGVSGSENPCVSKGFSPYIKELYPKWNALHTQYGGKKAESDNLVSIVIPPISKDFVIELQSNLTRLKKIYDQVKGIDAIANGEAAGLYREMMIAYGFNDIENSIGVGGSVAGLAQLLGAPGNFGPGTTREQIENQNITADGVDIVAAGVNLQRGLQAQAQIYEELRKITHVKARLTANTISGSAPLTVLFNALGTQDPAGGSIQGENITWDLAGALTYEELTASERPQNGVVVPPDGDATVDCTTLGNNESQFIGETAKRCTFNKPGTYTAAIKVESNNPNQFAPGISILTIRVEPRTTKIDLEVEPAGRDPIPVLKYQGESIIEDKRLVTVTTTEAVEQEISFNASPTEAEQYRWSFGDGTNIEFSSNAEASHQYEGPGEYEVTLDVLSPLEVLDRKTFTLKVAGIAARISPPRGTNSFVNTPLIFDGTQSRSDLGQITNYEWSIALSQGQENIPEQALEIYKPFTDSGQNLRQLEHSFPYPLEYDITLTVTDDTGNSESETISNFQVESQAPVAAFDFEIPENTQPSTYHFDAAASYDPDGENEFIEYLWTVDPVEGGDWEFVGDSDENDRISKIKFIDEGLYDVTLRATDSLTQPPEEEFDEITQTIEVTNTLDVAWGDDQEVTAILDDESRVEVDFTILSDNAIAYEIDFGDGDVSTGDISNERTITHAYTEGGRYTVRVTVFDKEDKDNTIQRRVFIGGRDAPIAKAEMLVNGVRIYDLTQPVEIYKNDQITFEGGESKNTDGTGRRLEYSWDFGDTERSSQRAPIHSYSELSPTDPGYFTVTLRVFDADDPSLTDEDQIQVKVVSAPPKIGTIQAIPLTNNDGLTTPSTINLRTFGSEDPDGNITQYRWWYYDTNSPNEQLGIQITQAPAASVVIGTNGPEGQEVTYGFGLEITDNDNLKDSSEDSNLPMPTVTVENGPNELPRASFSVNQTSVFTGDAVTFNSSSTDSDGNIVSYVWDVEGDGFFNNSPTDQPSIEHVYSRKNLQGYDVRLKVVDDKGGESVSTPVKIFVDSIASDPVASFTSQPVPNTSPLRIRFNSTSEPDNEAGARINIYQWDFDTGTDSNGDGDPANDKEALIQSPEYLYSEPGTYEVKLKIIDNNGNEAEVRNNVTVPTAGLPEAGFDFTVENDRVSFQNQSTADSSAGLRINEFLWDFDLDTDSDEDGDSENDRDSNLENPIFEYFQSGSYKVKLTITDNLDQAAEAIKTVAVAIDEEEDTPDEEPSLDDEPDESVDTPEIIPILKTSPVPSADGIVYLPGETGSVTFDFSDSEGPIVTYIIDKNINFDTDGNGVPNDDEDFKTTLPGSWRTNFNRSWGRTVVKLTAIDIYGNTETALQEIKFN